MAKQPRKQLKAPPKPITAHQLFPAVVALWFGALFGLGSLAVRPSLLENLVIQSRIDLVVPAAAPPLGITARALVALLLAALGSAIGIAIARRLARPKPEVRERKRSKLATREEGASRQAYAGPAEPADAETETVALAGRRRPLAIDHQEPEFVPHEPAPLPGGAPQILDISSVGFAAEPADAPLDLGGYAQPPAPVAAVEASRQVFQPAAPQFTPAPAPVEASCPAETAAAVADGRQVFGHPTPPPAPAEPRQIFGQPIQDGHVDPEFVRAAGFQTSVFDTPEPSPLFAPRAEAPEAPEAAAAIQPAAMPAPFEVPAAPEVPAFTVPAAQVPPSELLAAPAPDRAPVAEPAAALPGPAGLAMTDLAARLAESMARRRAARARAEAAPPEPAAVLADDAAPPEPAIVEPAPAPTSAFVPPPPIPAEAFAEAAPARPAAPIPVPAAMRPLDLGGFEDEDDLADLLPPRRFAMPEILAPQPPVPAEAPEAAETEVEPSAEDNYASLLGIAPAAPRHDFVRVEEPAPESAAIEPVVIFPGQMARPAAVPDEGGFRRFDAPATAGFGQPVAASDAAPAIDREESERALRMALANLQRMSGAA